MEEEKEHKAPVRVRLVIADRFLTKEQRSQGLSQCWAAIRPELATVDDFARDIIDRLSLKCSSIHRLVFSMDGFIFPPFASTLVFRDNDTIRVERKVYKVRKTSLVISDKNCQIEGNKNIDKQTVLSDSGILSIENGENANQKKKNNDSNKKKRVLTEITGTKRKKHRRVEGPEKSRHGSNLDDLDAQNLKNTRNSWSQSDDRNEIINNMSSDVRESDKEDDINFESLYPLTCLPAEGDIIAYRVVETSSGRPELSVFRVGKVIKFDPITMLILLGPVPQYPIFPDGEISESQKAMYKEDGTLEIDFGCLVDLRLVEESESGKGHSKYKAFNWENGTDSHAGGLNNNMNSSWEVAEAYKTGWGTRAPNISRERASWQGMGQRGSRMQSCRGSRGRNGGMHQNLNSAWQSGEDSNANNAMECHQGNWSLNNSRYGISKPHRGQIRNRFGLRGSFSRGTNNRAGINDNTAWEANSEVTHANQPAQTQENGWDTWIPNTSRDDPWSEMKQYCSGLRSRGSFSRAQRSGRGGRHSNLKFSK